MTRGLFALDIDGVLTDGRVSLDAAGDERKLLSYRDIDAVFQAKREGLAVALLTAEDTPVARRIAGRLKADHLIAGCRDKGAALEKLAADLGLGMGLVCFIGDSHKDVDALKLAGLGLAPADADSAALDAADVGLCSRGGDGVVAEGLSFFLDQLASEGISVAPVSEEASARVGRAIHELISVLEDLGKSCLDQIVSTASLLQKTIENGGTIYTFGNGGSAADAQHFAAEIVGFFQGGSGLGRAVALNADTALLTALANDVGYDQVFAHQLRVLGQPGDLAVAFSTSGRSANILSGLEVARENGLGTVLVTGAGAPGIQVSDLRITVPSTDTQRIQEVHGLVFHLLCKLTRGVKVG